MNLIKLINGSKIVRDILGVPDWKDIVRITANSVTRRVGENQFETNFYGHRKFEGKLTTNMLMNLRREGVWKHLERRFGKPVDLSYLSTPKFQVLTSYHQGPQEFLTDFNPDADPESTSVDGFVRRHAVDESFATIVAGAGTQANDASIGAMRCEVQGSSTTDQFASVFKVLTLFDTSSLGAGTVDSAIWKGYFDSGTATTGLATTAFDFDIVSSSPASNTALATSDYSTFGSTVFANIAYGSITQDAYNNFTLDANGRDNVNPTGISKFGTQSSWVTDATFGGTWASGLSTGIGILPAGSANPPILTVTFTPASGTAKFAPLLGVG